MTAILKQLAEGQMVTASQGGYPPAQMITASQGGFPTAVSAGGSPGSSVLPGTSSGEPVPHLPPSTGTTMSKNKKETKRAREKQLREEAEEQEQRRQDQARACGSDLHRQVRTMESARSRAAAKENKQNGKKAKTNQNTDMEETGVTALPNNESETSTKHTGNKKLHKPDKTKVLKHGRDKKTGKMGVKFWEGGGPKHVGSDGDTGQGEQHG